MRKHLDRLIERLTKALGPDLLSVVLYGSAARDEHHADFSDLNVLCVLTGVTPSQLRAAQPVFRWWLDLGHPPPMMLSEHEVETSTDCYSIEFQDMKLHRRILFGKDPIANLTIDRKFYRAQVERELRSKLLRLRTKSAPVLSDNTALARLMASSISTFCVLFRHALILTGAPVPENNRALLERSAEVFGIDAKPFLQLLEARTEKAKLKSIDAAQLLGSYLRELSVVVDAVDRIAADRIEKE
jgi:hypothetical protein